MQSARFCAVGLQGRCRHRPRSTAPAQSPSSTGRQPASTRRRRHRREPLRPGLAQMEEMGRGCHGWSPARSSLRRGDDRPRWPRGLEGNALTWMLLSQTHGLETSRLPICLIEAQDRTFSWSAVRARWRRICCHRPLRAGVTCPWIPSISREPVARLGLRSDTASRRGSLHFPSRLCRCRLPCRRLFAQLHFHPARRPRAPYATGGRAPGLGHILWRARFLRPRP